MRFAITTLVIVLTVVAAAAWAVWQGLLVSEVKAPEVAEEVMVSPPASGDLIPTDWQQYEGGAANIGFAYPPEVRITEGENSVSVLYIGPTQAEGTEIYDGYAVAFERRVFSEGITTLRQFAEQRLADDAPHGEIVKPLAPITVNGQEGFTYALEGLGRFTIIVLPDGEDAAVTVSYLVADPERGDYQEMVDILLSTLVVAP